MTIRDRYVSPLNTRYASAPMQPDGNSVDIDTESSKLAENGMDYESLVSVEKTRLEILQSAMGASS